MSYSCHFNISLANSTSVHLWYCSERKKKSFGADIVFSLKIKIKKTNFHDVIALSCLQTHWTKLIFDVCTNKQLPIKINSGHIWLVSFLNNNLKKKRKKRNKLLYVCSIYYIFTWTILDVFLYFQLTVIVAIDFFPPGPIYSSSFLIHSTISSW